MGFEVSSKVFFMFLDYYLEIYYLDNGGTDNYIIPKIFVKLLNFIFVLILQIT